MNFHRCNIPVKKSKMARKITLCFTSLHIYEYVPYFLKDAKL